jgi:hypothetical protein
VGDQAVWVWDAVAVDHHHPTDTVVAAAVIEVEAFVADRQRPDLPMGWDVVVEMIATAVAIVVDLVDLPHRAIGTEAAVVADTTGAEVEATGNETDPQVLIDVMEEEETVTVVGVDTNKHYGLSLMYISLYLFTTRSSCLAQH